MKNFIRILVREEFSQGKLNSREIILFKTLNEKSKGKKKSEIISLIEDLIRYLGLETGTAQFYYLLWKANYRPEGDYSKISPSEFIGGKSLPPSTTSNTNAKDFVRGKVPFRGSNLQGKWGVDNNGTDFYVVISYGWYPIYLFKDNRWYKNTNPYSRATSRQMSHTHPSEYDDDIRKEVTWVTKSELDDLMNGKTHEEIMRQKPKKLINQKEDFISVRPSFISSYGSAGIDNTPIKIKFKINDVREENGKAIVDVIIQDVGQREMKNVGGYFLPTNKMIPSKGAYLRGEIPNVDVRRVETLVKNKILHNFKDYIGNIPSWEGDSFDIESNPENFMVKFNFIHQNQ